MRNYSTIIVFWLCTFIGVGAQQVSMPNIDGGQTVINITEDIAFFDAGGEIGNIPNYQITGITFIPKAGEKIEITFEEIDLQNGALIKVFDGAKLLIEEYDEEEDETYYYIPTKHRIGLSGTKTNEVIKSGADDGKLTVFFQNANGTGKGWKAKVVSVPTYVSRVATFEDLDLEPESRWWGDPESSNYQSTFQSGAYVFTNTLIEDYLTWGGFAYSNFTQTDFNPMEFLDHQFRSAIGSGCDNSKNYAVVYPFGARTRVSISDKPDGETISGFYITNNAWVKYVSKNGTGMASTDDPTGKEPFKQGDWYKITATGSNKKTVEFYLADYRSENPADHYTLDNWEWFDLRALGDVKYVDFKADGSRRNSAGSTIPFYFCMDNFGGERKITTVDEQIIKIGSELKLNLSNFFEETSTDADIEYFITDSLSSDFGNAIIDGDQLNITTSSEGKSEIIVQRKIAGKSTFAKIPVSITTTTGNQEISNSLNPVRVYPNPAKDFISINSDENVEIFSLNGMKVYTNSNYKKDEKINLSQFEKGIYFVKTNNQTTKFIKQ